MFLGQLIHQQRLNKQLTQSELAAGICTQNTISKIEKKKLPPTIPILIKICTRLGLTLNELFTEFNALDTASDEGVISAEVALLAGDSGPAAALITDIDFKATEHPYPAIFFFFNGYLSYLDHQSELQIFSAYNSFTAAIGDDTSTLKLLLNTGMGLIYQEAGEELADFYFNNNINFINQLDHINVIDVQRVLFASRHTAAYMINQHRIDAAIEFLTKALKLSQKNQIIKQVDHLYYLRARARQQSGRDYAEDRETALVFAKYLKNNA
ncbi:helix-turn-helix domain-containing protein, partial [Latilactobacillus curvatus]|uniref:helix-turn-helix domain-containing protein n=1 Tax=Latilactobacillus curvatus TaxID=28038 RepID=UPI0020731902|nr:helix-turn-helix transcriptional regulator [Latilactobacillus curvatus]MCM6843740.1 helix-turn-helix domain-containing protein [Latilactobacillus curvatus]MCM6861374.1 helix-turn-helix domain-containing protein [Latilactobacillus curvatus]MCM6868673.1 helix-turn-helix domain-containing protein [Latilactobacillus curvatus]